MQALRGKGGQLRQQAFAPDRYGQTEFPRIQSVVIDRAVDALTLAPAVLAGP